MVHSLSSVTRVVLRRSVASANSLARWSRANSILASRRRPRHTKGETNKDDKDNKERTPTVDEHSDLNTHSTPPPAHLQSPGTAVAADAAAASDPTPSQSQSVLPYAIYDSRLTRPNSWWSDRYPDPDSSAAAVAALGPCPRRLPIVYTHKMYLPPEELRGTTRRLTHVFTCMAVACFGVMLVFFSEAGAGARAGGRPHVLTEPRAWAQRTVAALTADPALQFEKEKEERRQMAESTQKQRNDHGVAL